jgi:PAS domain S-box-containing protein
LPIHDESGRVVRWVGTNTDVEQQRADREALKQLNTDLERRVDERTRERDRIWRNSPDLMVVLTPDGVLTDMNPACATILGWKPSEVIGARIDALVHPDDLAEAEIALVRAGKGVLPTFECRVLHSDSSHRIVAWTAAPEGDVIFAFGRDITPDMAQKKALALAEEQLRQSQKMDAIGQLTGGIAHDFNNMLASVYGSIQLLQRKVKSGKLEGFETLLERASTSTQRATALTQRLLAFARRQSLDIRRVDVARLIESVEDMFARTLGPKVDLKIEIASGLWSARIDASQLENALLNLVINARDAMPDGGCLTIEALNFEIDAGYAASQAEVNAGDYVAVRVTDNGAGMPASVIARAFEPFFTTKPIGQGTGLGLSMVYGFVKQAGGHIRIHSKLGHGTTVSLYLPLDLSDGTAVEPERAAATNAQARTGETVLVVEDEESVRAVIVAVLEELGYRFIESADAAAALAVIDTGTRIDLLVSDVGLPGMNGRQLAEIATARRPGLKVLFVTGYAEQAAVRHGFLSAGMEMITKPFVIDELASRIRSILATP